MDEIAAVLKKFGDEQSTMLDQFQRLSFEVQRNQAILGRSLSEPGVGRPRYRKQIPIMNEEPPLVTQVKQGKRGGGSVGFNKVLKKLFEPIFGRKKGKANREVPTPVPDPKNPKSWKALSRSLRL